MQIHTVTMAFEANLPALAAAVGGDVVWLDSGAPDDANAAVRARSRWSILGWCDGPFRAEYTHRDRIASIRTTSASARWFGPTRDSAAGAFDTIDILLAATPAPPQDRLENTARPGIPSLSERCGFALGWVGYLGYELGRESGGPDRTADGHADLDLRFVDRAIVVDHHEKTTDVLALVDDRDPMASDANHAWAASMSANLRSSGRTAQPSSRPAAVTAPTGRIGPGPGTESFTAVGRTERDAYADAVDSCRAEIRDGNAFQVCLTTTFDIDLDGAGGDHCWMSADGGWACSMAVGSWVGTAMRLRSGGRVPFGAFLRLGNVTVCSRSPERFLTIGTDGTVVAEPVKGTSRRGATPDDDVRLRSALLASGKERAENIMIVDLLRNDLLRSAVPGSVSVDRLCDVESYADVHQLVSTVSGRVRPGTSTGSVVRAAFPPGSMTGAPKIRAMAIADRLEQRPRGVYAGAIGYFSTTGAVDLSVAIRTLVTVRSPDGATRSSIGAGGAVTWESDPGGEADEVATKVLSTLAGFGDTTIIW